MRVKIYQPAKTITQSGRKTRSWFLEPVLEQKTQSIDNIMGWTSSNNTLTQLKLKFKTSEDAAKYTQQQGWSYAIIKPQTARIFKKSYIDNFL